jgi:hypothetical protein
MAANPAVEAKTQSALRTPTSFSPDAVSEASQARVPVLEGEQLG